jgi:hypothetical protein
MSSSEVGEETFPEAASFQEGDRLTLKRVDRTFCHRKTRRNDFMM